MVDHKQRAVLIGLLLIFVFLHYGQLLLAPNSVLLADTGDGIKNYYTFIWQVKHGTNAWEFTGMNHPYGEHVFFTDGHPAIAWIIGALGRIFPWIADQGIGILNVLLIAGIVITGLVLYELLGELLVSPWSSVGCAFGITVLAPQAARLGGHLALSWSLCIPLTWWIVLRAMRSDRAYGWYLSGFLQTLFWLLTHTYLGVMAAAFGGGIALMNAVLTTPRTRTQLLCGLRTFTSIAVLPMLSFVLMLGLTDAHHGRSEHPSGIFNYTAEPDDVLLPSSPPLRPVLDAVSHGTIRTQWEASAYIGLATIVVMIIWGVHWFRSRKRPVQSATIPPGLRSAWLPALLLLLFAFCFPFKSWPELLRYAPGVEQFRAVGRFTWPFFFVSTLFAAVVLDHWVRSTARSLNWKLALGLIVPLTWVIEGWHVHASNGAHIRSESPFAAVSQHAKDLEEIGLQRLQEHQAILPLPYFNFGSESFTRPSLDGITQAALPISFHLELPILGSILSRVSVPESKSLTQLVSAPWYPKPIERSIEPERPILIVRSEEPLSANEDMIIANASLIGAVGSIRLYSITPAQLFRDTRDEELERFASLRPSLFVRNGLLLSDTLSTVHYLDFDDTPHPTALAGAGAFTAPKHGVNSLGRFSMTGIRAGDTIMATAWFFNGTPEALNHGLRLEAVDGDHVSRILPNEAENIDGQWSLVEFPIVAKHDDPTVELRTVCNDYLGRELIIDELYLRRSDQDVYRVPPTATQMVTLLHRNGHRIRRIY